MPRPGSPAGTLWVLTSSHPPGTHIWPDGYKEIVLTTHDVNNSSWNTGTMWVTGAGNKVYVAKDLLYWIPAAAFTGVNALQTTNTTWNADL